ncbi:MULTISPECIES: acetyl-CoA carboxylase, carboxyltransferase subunit beta [unclassified Aureispira]|uniref:acetyl-CoA carboxylase, carboxyltransferase subunit beta n=1 Tax=unclassified Aureispira TaxID=2649989 RepID=UPI000698FD39|nr:MULTISPECIES: acetyl-CoA carboxylase, carboxyltransferase subunit beta [unclassified Aureispira]WMX16586.1 acetyl-CoA carboxylase, carboxyltransferase subunit beta [Aureispira sp. CCB-E]
MGWYKRDKDSITTSTSQKKETPDGIWHQCNACKTTSTVKDLVENLYVCPSCNQHERIGSQEYFEIIFDKSKYTEMYSDIIAYDFLEFTDLKPYQERLDSARKKTDLDSAMRVAKGKVQKMDLVIAAMDFGFIGGSMGSVMGEKVSKAIDYCIEHKTPFMIISKSGGARMMESAFSLMQMAKISAKLTQLAEAQVPYLSFLTDPTTGGVSASFAMLGDFNFSEPGALIAFAGPRIVKETLKLKELPKGFQRAEFLMERGFLDFIVERKNLKDKIEDILYILKK